MTNTIFHGVSNLPTTYRAWQGQSVPKGDFEDQLGAEIRTRHGEGIYKLPEVVGYGLGKDSETDEYIINLYLARHPNNPAIYPNEIGGLRTKQVVTGVASFD